MLLHKNEILLCFKKSYFLPLTYTYENLILYVFLSSCKSLSTFDLFSLDSSVCLVTTNNGEYDCCHTLIKLPVQNYVVLSLIYG